MAQLACHQCATILDHKAHDMLLELQKSLLRPHPGQRSAAVGSRRTLWRSPRIGLHPGRQRLGRAGGRRHGEADDGTYYVQQLASRTASVAQSAEVLDGADGLHEQDVDVKAILSDPHLEGDPLQFLKVTEAYWTVRPVSARWLRSVDGAVSAPLTASIACLPAVPDATRALCQMASIVRTDQHQQIRGQ